MYGMALCAGAGGLENGLKLALGSSYRCVCYVEREAFAASVLVARMEDKILDEAVIWDDIKSFDGRKWRGIIQIVSAGFPCQPFSVAGRQQGVEDSRHLWPDIERIIGEVQPQWCFFENVPGLLTTRTPDNRYAYQIVSDGLYQLGYTITEGLFSANEVGAPHKRERLFFLAPSQEYRDQRDSRTMGYAQKNSEEQNDGAKSYSSIKDVAHAERSEERRV